MFCALDELPLTKCVWAKLVEPTVPVLVAEIEGLTEELPETVPAPEPLVARR
jgi:hypothetical protein